MQAPLNKFVEKMMSTRTEMAKTVADGYEMMACLLENELPGKNLQLMMQAAIISLLRARAADYLQIAQEKAPDLADRG